MEVVVGIVVLAGLVVSGFSYAKRKRRGELFAKYGDMDVVNRIMAKQVWQGMSAEQLIDSWGRPLDIGTRVYKSKTVETYKYNQTGKNRYASRVTVENGWVVGWEQK